MENIGVCCHFFSSHILGGMQLGVFWILVDIAGEVYNYGAYPAGRIFLTSEMEFYVFFFAKISPYKLYGRRYQLLEVDK